MALSVHALCDAGRLVRIARVGRPPLDDDDAIELTFESGAIFHLDTGPVGASDIAIRSGPLLDHAFGHLLQEEPESWAEISGDWTYLDITPEWAQGGRLSHPRRLAMTKPYRLDVGYLVTVNSRELALFAEADLVFAVALNDPSVAGYGLEAGTPA
jgi:hypothetical protein